MQKLWAGEVVSEARFWGYRGFAIQLRGSRLYRRLSKFEAPTEVWVGAGALAKLICYNPSANYADASHCANGGWLEISGRHHGSLESCRRYGNIGRGGLNQ